MRWIAAAFDAADLAPEDLIAHRVREIVAADAKIKSIFGATAPVGVVGAYAPIDFERFPQYLVATGLVDEEQKVGMLDNTVTIYHVVRFVQQRPELLPDNAPGLATLWRHVRRLLSARGAKLLNYMREDNVEVQLASRSEPGRVSTTMERALEGGSFAFRSVMPWEYELRLDPETQQIRNLVNG